MLVYPPMANTIIDHDRSALHELLGHPHTGPALAMAAPKWYHLRRQSATTFPLTEWVRERGPFSIEQAVHSADAAAGFGFYGFADRGPGGRQTGRILNSSIWQALKILPPQYSSRPACRRQALPARRAGYRYTIVRPDYLPRQHGYRMHCRAVCSSAASQGCRTPPPLVLSP